MSEPCIGCGQYYDVHWHWCKQKPLSEWRGFVIEMTEDEMAFYGNKQPDMNYSGGDK